MINIRDIITLVLIGALSYFYYDYTSTKQELKEVKVNIKKLEVEKRTDNIIKDYYKDLYKMPYERIKVEKDNNSSNITVNFDRLYDN